MKTSKLRLIFGFLLFSSLCFVGAPKTEALTNIFPDPRPISSGGDFSQTGNVRAVVANANGTSFLLDANVSSLRIYIRASDTSAISGANSFLTVVGTNCADTGDAGNVRTSFGLYRVDPSNVGIVGGAMGGGLIYSNDAGEACSDPSNPINQVIDYNASGFAQSTVYPGYVVLQLDARYLAGFGWNSYKLVGPAGSVISYYASSASGDKFAIKSNNNTGRGNFSLKFATGCGVTTPSTRALKFFDADAGQGNQQFDTTVNTVLNGVSLNITDNMTMANPIPPGSTPPYGGGNGERGWFWRALAPQPTQYTWIWNNIWEDNGIQFELPFDGFNAAYNCQPPVTGGPCDTFSGEAQNGDTDIPQGSYVGVGVFGRNTGTSVWGSSGNLVYIYFGPPSGAYLQKFSATPDRNPDGTFVQPPTFAGLLNPGQDGPGVFAGVVDTSTPGLKSYTYNVYRLVSIVSGVPNWQSLGSCNFSVTVVAPPVIPTASFVGQPTCQSVSWTAAWVPARAASLSGTLQLKSGGSDIGAPYNFTLANGEIRSLDTFTQVFPSAPIHLGSYSVVISIEGETGPELPINGTPCVRLTCSPQSPYEFGSPAPYNLTYDVTNETNRAEPSGRYGVLIGAPINQNVAGALEARASTPTPYVHSYRPTSGATISAVLSYNGGGTSISSGSPCTVVVQHIPYMKVFSGDVGSGGGFGTSCTGSNATGIFAYMRPPIQHSTTGDRSGSGGQINAYAWGSGGTQNGDISGFATAERRSTASIIRDLAFGAVNTVADSNQADVGGNLSGNAPCMPDYFYGTQYPAESSITEDLTSSTITDLNSNTDNSKQLIRNGNLTVAGVNNYQRRKTFYVNGNLYITGSIQYHNNYGAVGVPNLTFVVLGDIYINPSVTVLDGTYIAQPSAPGVGGRIYTCATSLGSRITSATAVYTSCSGGYGAGGIGGLTVNGSMVAQKIILNRAVRTLNDSRFRETASASQAAEIFNFSPEVYLSPPIFRPNSTATSGNYDAIGILPPIL